MAHYAVEKKIFYDSKKWKEIGYLDILPSLKHVHPRWKPLKAEDLNTYTQPGTRAIQKYFATLKKAKDKMPDLIDEEQLFRDEINPEDVGSTYNRAVESANSDKNEGSEESSRSVHSGEEEIKQEDVEINQVINACNLQPEDAGKCVPALTYPVVENMTNLLEEIETMKYDITQQLQDKLHDLFEPRPRWLVSFRDIKEFSNGEQLFCKDTQELESIKTPTM